MNTEPPPNRCPKCGAAVPAASSQGLCTKCLLAAATVPTEAGPSTRHRPEPPPLARVAAAFPHLELLELIGAGGMGAVYKARQPKLDRYVALKLLPESLAQEPAFAERFQREGRLLARLSHANIVTVHDFGQADGFFYLLMEYVDGVNLRQAMQAGRFSPAQAMALVPRICEALQYAHDEGILHRDIKPENILLDHKGRVKIADFGIAKLAGELGEGATLTASGGALGTPQYMAPEQIERPSEVDHRADIYSLGVVFYELLTGELPLGRFAPPSAKVSLDDRVDDIVLRALAKERELRQQSAREVKREVEDVATAWRNQPQPPPSVPAAAPAPLWQIGAERKPLLLLVLLVLLGLLAYAEATSLSSFGRLVRGGFQSGWGQALIISTGIAGLIALATAVGRHRAAWLPSLDLPRARDPGTTAAEGLNACLRLSLLGLLVCLTVQYSRWLISWSVLLAELVSRAAWLGAANFCLRAVFWLILPGYMVWRELRRRTLVPPVAFPAWASRLAVVLVLLAIFACSSELGARRGMWYTTLVMGGFPLLLTSLALWTRSRVWRALALAFGATFFVSGLSGAVGLVIAASRGQLVSAEAPRSDPMVSVLLDYPGLLAFSTAVAALCYAAGLLALLHPQVRLAFGLPPRRGPARQIASGSPPTPQ